MAVIKDTALPAGSTPTGSDIYTGVQGGGSVRWTHSQLSEYLGVLQGNTTVNITAGSTAAQIQALINALPKNLNGYTLTFQFADGSYSLSSNLTFTGFFGGLLRVFGNSSDSTAALSKSVDLQLGTRRLEFSFNRCDIQMFYIKLTATGLATVFDQILLLETNSGKNFISFCSATGGGFGRLRFARSNAIIQSTYIDNLGYGISCEYDVVNSNNNVFNAVTTNLAQLDGGVIIIDSTIGSNTYINSNSGQIVFSDAIRLVTKTL